MEKLPPQDERSRKIVDLFYHRLLWLKQIHYIRHELFEDNCSEHLIRNTAPGFFADLNIMLINHYLLEIAKLTDPAKSRKQENFTIANLIESIDWPPDRLKEINKLNQTVLAFRRHIVPARNKLVAHYDKTTVMSRITLGAFPKGVDKKTLDALEHMCNVMYGVAFGEIFGSIVLDKGVLDFKEVLAKAIAFDKLFADSKGKDLSYIYSLLQDTRNNRA